MLRDRMCLCFYFLATVMKLINSFDIDPLVDPRLNVRTMCCCEHFDYLKSGT